MISARLVVLAFPLVIAVTSFFLPSYWITLLTSAGIIALVCLGLGVMASQAGIASFGQAAFVGVAAYTTAILTTQFGISPWISLFGSLLATTLAAFVIGWVTVRLSGHFLVLGTIGWGVSFFYLLANIPALGGYNGIGGLPSIIPISGLEGRIALNILVWSIVCLAALVFMNILDSAPGRAIRAVRFKAMAESFGVDTAHYKLTVFVLAAQAAGLAGWLQAHFLRFVNPNPFSLNASVEYMFVSIIGGVGHLLGGMIGAIVAIFTKSNLQTVLPGIVPVTGNYEVVAFGVLVLLLLHFAPSGITQWVPERLRARARLPEGSAQELPERDKPGAGTTVVRADHVSKHFGGVKAVNDVSLDVRAAEIVALVGPNGAGKSTMFDLLSGLAGVTSGAVYLMEDQVQGASARSIVRRGVARTFQHSQLNEDMTVLENIALGGHLRQPCSVIRAALRMDRAEEHALLAKSAELAAFLGLGDVLHQRAGWLALGQQRIVEVARALMVDPVLVLLDEPAAGLRYHEKQALIAAIHEMRKRGIAVLIVEHDLDFVGQIADRTVVLDFGSKIAEGTPDEVLENQRVIEAYLGAPRNRA